MVRFNNDSSIVGRTVEINNRPFTVVGVAPKGFQARTSLRRILWIPLGMLLARPPPSQGAS